MKVRQLASIALSLAILMLTGACSRPEPVEEIPTVSDENCSSENIRKIKNKAMQEDFASKCFRRGQFKPSPPKKW